MSSHIKASACAHTINVAPRPPSRISVESQGRPQTWLFFHSTGQKQMCEMSRKALCRYRHQSGRNTLLEQHLSSAINAWQGAAGQGDYLWPTAELLQSHTPLQEMWWCSCLCLPMVMHLAPKQGDKISISVKLVFSSGPKCNHQKCWTFAVFEHGL